MLLYRVTSAWDETQTLCENSYNGHLWTVADRKELYAVLHYYLLIVHRKTLLYDYYESLHTRMLYIGLRSNKVEYLSLSPVTKMN